MNDRKVRAVIVLILLAILIVFGGTGFISFERLCSGITLALLILIYF